MISIVVKLACDCLLHEMCYIGNDEVITVGSQTVNG